MGSRTKPFHYDQQGNLIAESKQNGKAVREYIYLGGYRIAMVAEQATFAKPKDHSKKSDKRSDKHSKEQSKNQTHKSMKHGKNQLALYYIHNDHLGTPNQVTDASQNTVWIMNQTPFGELTAANDNNFTMPLRFPGQYADAESGLSYNYFRDYDPSLGRYVQSDPIGVRGGVGVYAYAASQPTSQIDPRGLTLIHLAILGAVVGGISSGASEAIVGGSFSQIVSATAFGAVTGAALANVAAAPIVGAFIGGLTNFASQIIGSLSDGSNATGEFNVDLAQIGTAAALGALTFGVGVKLAGGSLLGSVALEQQAFLINTTVKSICNSL